MFKDFPSCRLLTLNSKLTKIYYRKPAIEFITIHHDTRVFLSFNFYDIFVSLLPGDDDVDDDASDYE